MRNLQSKDTDIRRSARLVVSKAAPEDVAYILKYVREKLKKTQDIYRTKLGVSLALTEMLRRNKSLRDRMRLETADLEMLLILPVPTTARFVSTPESFVRPRES